MKKILILSAENTGHGHKSITQSLREQYDLLHLPVTVHEIDSFTLGGKLMQISGMLYDKVAVYTPLIWKLAYRSSNIQPRLFSYFVSFMIKRNLLKLIRDINPDVIVSLHACFVGSVINILEREKLNIPVVTYVADFDNVTHLWADKRTSFTLCPTENAARTMLKLGIPEEKIKIFGFPARERFNKYNIENEEMELVACTKEAEPLRFLIMNGSQGTGKSVKMARILLDNFDCHVTVVAGRDRILKRFLEDKLHDYKDRVTVLGFVENIEYYMLTSDILILRASPNVVTEAVNLCKPIIVTGSLMGQEEKNPQFVADNNLGIICMDIKRLPEAVNSLLAEDGKKMREIYSRQLRFRKSQAAKDIAEFIFNVKNAQ